MAVNNVCRLCLSNKELFWVFDQSLICPGNMKDIIVITAGVEISERDIISQKICKNCFQLTIRMFNFRERAMKTNKYLQGHCKELLINCEMSMKAPNTQTGNDDATEQKKIVTPTIIKSPSRILPNLQTESPSKYTRSVVQDIKLSRKKTHQSVDSIFATYADIKLPSTVLTLDLNPTLCMDRNVVEEYLHSKNLDQRKTARTLINSLRAIRRISTMNKNSNDKDGEVPNTSKNEMRVVPSIDMACTSEEGDEEKSRIKVKRKIKNCQIESSKAAANENEEGSTDSRKVSSKRRRLSLSELTSEPAPTLMDTLRLKPTENLAEHRCTICRATHTTVEALKKHSQEHFKCQYCRIRFRVLERKEKHLEMCMVKRALHTKPYIELQRIDYHFKKIDGASTTEETCEDKHNQDRRDYVSEDTDESKDRTTSREDTTTGQDIIEILSDDEEGTSSSTSSVPSVIQMAPSLFCPEQIQPTIYSGTGIVKPSIEIKENTLFNSIDTTNTDTRVFRELLDRMMPMNLKISVTGLSQTELPSNEHIIVNAPTNTAELKGLLPQLYVFKIPIDIKKGDLKVNYTKTKEQRKIQIKRWVTCKAIEIKAPNGTLFNEVNLRKRISLGIPLLKPVKTDSGISIRPKILNTAYTANMSRQSGTDHSSDVISNSNQNLQSGQTQRASHQPNQNINHQHTSLQTRQLNQNRNINPQYPNQSLAQKTPQNQNMKLPRSVSQNFDKDLSQLASPNVLRSLKPLRVNQNLKPPRVQQNLNLDLIPLVPQTMNHGFFQVPQNVFFTTNGSTAPAYYVQSVAAVSELMAPDIGSSPHATQIAVASTSNVTLTNIPQNLDVSIGTTSPAPVTSGNSLSNLHDDASYTVVNSSVINTEIGSNVDAFRDNSLFEKNSNSISVATIGSNDNTAATRPIIRVKNLCDLK